MVPMERKSRNALSQVWLSNNVGKNLLAIFLSRNSFIRSNKVRALISMHKYALLLMKLLPSRRDVCVRICCCHMRRKKTARNIRNRRSNGFMFRPKKHDVTSEHIWRNFTVPSLFGINCLRASRTRSSIIRSNDVKFMRSNGTTSVWVKPCTLFWTLFMSEAKSSIDAVRFPKVSLTDACNNRFRSFVPMFVGSWTNNSLLPGCMICWRIDDNNFGSPSDEIPAMPMLNLWVFWDENHGKFGYLF